MSIPQSRREQAEEAIENIEKECVDVKRIVKPIYAVAKRLVNHKNRIVVICCPYCGCPHYHGDGTKDGSGKIRGDRLADCGNGHYELMDFSKSV